MKFIFFVLIAMFAFSGCSKNKYIESNIAEIREIIYEGKNEDLNVSLICGEREEDYKLNGYATPLIEFGVITFEIKNDNLGTENAKFILYVGTEKYNGDLQKNPFDGTLVADVKKKILLESGVSVKILLDDYEKEIKLTRLDINWNISANDVKEIISKEFKKEIDSIVIDKEFNGEIYIKILNDADIYVGDYYWYVSIISRSGGKLNAIISRETGEILSMNSTLDKL